MSRRQLSIKAQGKLTATALCFFFISCIGAITPANSKNLSGTTPSQAAPADAITARAEAPGQALSEELKAARAAFREKRFGIFLHWGIYSMYGQGEWALNYNGLTHEEYSKLAGAFYPAGFDAAEWVAAIKGAGARYLCITTRHHDGFSMFDTGLSDYNIVDATPFGRDIIAELAEECHKQGLGLHFYYSTLDWGREDYPRGRTGKETGRKAETNPDSYFDFMKGQLTELLTRYGKVDCIWLDGHWDHDEDTVEFDWRYDELYPLIHSLQPSCLIGNNHHITPFQGEDIQIFERDIPGENTAGWHSGGVSESLPLETCQTMNGSWGYRMRDQNYKSVAELIKYLVSTAGRDANLLLNVGPQPDGRFPQAALERLSAMGEWLEDYGETIYGSRADLVPPQPWGVVTHKADKVWLHVLPDELAAAKCGSRIFLPLDPTYKVKTAGVFGSTDRLRFKQYPEGLFVTLPAELPADCADFVIELSLKTGR